MTFPLPLRHYLWLSHRGDLPEGCGQANDTEITADPCDSSLKTDKRQDVLPVPDATIVDACRCWHGVLNIVLRCDDHVFVLSGRATSLASSGGATGFFSPENRTGLISARGMALFLSNSTTTMVWRMRHDEAGPTQQSIPSGSCPAAHLDIASSCSSSGCDAWDGNWKVLASRQTWPNNHLKLDFVVVKHAPPHCRPFWRKHVQPTQQFTGGDKGFVLLPSHPMAEKDLGCSASVR